MAQLLPPTHASRLQLFGQFSYLHDPRPGNPEHIVITGDWIRTHLTEVEIPQLRALGVSTRLMVHYRAAKAIQRLWEAWEVAGLLGHVRTFNGAWAPRYKRQTGSEAERRAKCAALGPASLSNHAWGTAFDINAAQYPLGKQLPTGDAFADLFPDAEFDGWFPGARFRTRPDPMHFELARVDP